MLGRAWKAAGVRSRTTLVSVLVVGGVLLPGFLGLAELTESRIEDSIASSTLTRALDVAALAGADALGGEIVTLSANQLIQVVAEGGVIAASPGLEGAPPIADARVPPGTTEEIAVAESVFERIERRSPLIEDESPYVVIASGYESASGPGVVLVASSLSPAEAAVNALWPLLWIGFPIALVAVGATVWVLTGWALRPVDAMREQADAISSAALSRRLPVPESRDEIRRLAETLNHMLERLESAAVRQRRFVSDASHELKTPLATIRTMLEVAEGDPGFEDWAELMAGLKREDERLETLTHDLLTLARIDEGGVVPAANEVNLDQVLGRVAKRTAETFPELTVDTSGIQAARVLGDGAALERLFWNLGSNAARYGNTRVWFECLESARGVVARVADDGPGIPPEERERVFERFVRLDESRGRHEGGTGLGLPVVRAIAQSHGGVVRVVESAGTTVEVVLPAIRT